jgi:hypothetical protein
MYGQEAPTLKFASVLCCTFMLLLLSLGSRRDHSGSDSGSSAGGSDHGIVDS